MSSPVVIGLSGKSGHGKDEVYRIARRLLRGKRIEREAFDDLLKQQVAKAVGFEVDFVEAQKDFFRPLLQWWGTEFRRNLCGNDYWVNRMRRQLKQHSLSDYIFVTDVRFPNEAELIRENGGVVVRVDRGDFIADENANKHATETVMDNYKFDEVIRNDGDLNQLEAAVKEFLSPSGE
jgi:hypothetical protein